MRPKLRCKTSAKRDDEGTQIPTCAFERQLMNEI